MSINPFKKLSRIIPSSNSLKLRKDIQPLDYINEARNALIKFETQQFEPAISTTTKRINKDNEKWLPHYNYLKDDNYKDTHCFTAMYKWLFYYKILKPSLVVDKAMLKKAFNESGRSAIYSETKAVNAFVIEHTNELLELNHKTLIKHSTGILEIKIHGTLGQGRYVTDGEKIFIIGGVNEKSYSRLKDFQKPIILMDLKTNTLRSVDISEYDRPLSKKVVVNQYFSDLRYQFSNDRIGSLLQATSCLGYASIGDKLDVQKLINIINKMDLEKESRFILRKNYVALIMKVLKQYEKETLTGINIAGYLEYVE